MFKSGVNLAFPPIAVFMVALTTLTLTTLLDTGLPIGRAPPVLIAELGPGAVDSDITLPTEFRSISGNRQPSTTAWVTSEFR